MCSTPAAQLPGNYLMVPAVLVRPSLPLAVLVSLFFLLRGHNAPGGGFVGGLVLATAVILQYIVGGTMGLNPVFSRIHPLYWIAVGLLSAASAGITAWVSGNPFLTSLAWHELPGLGQVHLSSVLLFDIGVFTCWWSVPRC